MFNYLNRIMVALVLSFLTGIPAAQAQELSSKIDSMLSPTFMKEGPGGVFMIVKKGEIYFKKAYGQANLELGVPMTTENVFQIGSMTKQFTAVAILMLVEEGKLKLEDDITSYIPDYPTQGQQITIHHLLTHTSGIKDFTKMKSIMEIARQDLSPKEVVDFFKNEPMQFKPGEQFQYNNSGYVLLGYILELVSGETYETFVEKRLFEKAGMKTARYASDRELIPNRAYGYHKRGAYTNKMWVSLSIPFSSGALMATVEDMWHWQQALNDHSLVSDPILQKAFRKYRLNNGQEFGYGYGWHLKNLNGMVIREHGGSIFGFKSMAVYIPEQELYVIGLTNCDCLSPTQITRDIAQLVLEFGG